MFGYDAKTNQKLSQWKTPNSPRPKKARQVQNNVKSMLIFFFWHYRFVHKEFVPPGQTVNGKFYWDVLRRLRENNRRKHSDKQRDNSLALHHDNALAHASLVMQQFLASMKTTVIPHPPYSPDLATCNVFLFPKMKMMPKGWRFDSTEEIQTESQDVMKTLTWNDFQQCFWSCKSHWDCWSMVKGTTSKGMRANINCGKCLS